MKIPFGSYLVTAGLSYVLDYIETFLLNKMNFSTLVATKASRVVHAARGRSIAEFGLRRAQGDGHLEATRATYIGGCASTSNVLAGENLSNLPDIYKKLES
ncbi:nicotinate phosphoribosyltransferase [groundwater metagenome]